MQCLPELWLLIFSWLPLFSLRAARLVCKEWNRLLDGQRWQNRLCPLHKSKCHATDQRCHRLYPTETSVFWMSDSMFGFALYMGTDEAQFAKRLIRFRPQLMRPMLDQFSFSVLHDHVFLRLAERYVLFDASENTILGEFDALLRSPILLLEDDHLVFNDENPQIFYTYRYGVTTRHTSPHRVCKWWRHPDAPQLFFGAHVDSLSCFSLQNESQLYSVDFPFNHGAHIRELLINRDTLVSVTSQNLTYIDAESGKITMHAETYDDALVARRAVEGIYTLGCRCFKLWDYRTGRPVLEWDTCAAWTFYNSGEWSLVARNGLDDDAVFLFDVREPGRTAWLGDNITIFEYYEDRLLLGNRQQYTIYKRA